MHGHREVMGGAAAQVNLTEVTKAVYAQAVDLGTVVGSIGRVGVDLDLKVDLERDTHGKCSRVSIVSIVSTVCTGAVTLAVQVGLVRYGTCIVEEVNLPQYS